MNAYFLIDRSGSMTSKWGETLSAVNGYVADLAKNAATAQTVMSVALFDTPTSTMDYTILRQGVTAKTMKPLDPKEATPRGWTPLFDAIGRLATQIAEDMPERATIIVVTDGIENGSRELNKDGAKSVLDMFRAKGYDVVFMGADFDAYGQSGSMGIGVGATINATKGGLRGATEALSARTVMYAGGITAASLNFSDADRLKAAHV